MDVVDEQNLWAITDPWERLDAYRQLRADAAAVTAAVDAALPEVVAAAHVPYSRDRNADKIAEVLGLSVGRVHQLLQKGRARTTAHTSDAASG